MVSREIEPNAPINPVLKTSTQKLQGSSPSVWQEFSLSVIKEKSEGLGLNFSGGLCSIDGESTPIFLTAIDSKSCSEKTKHIRVHFFLSF